METLGSHPHQHCRDLTAPLTIPLSDSTPSSVLNVSDDQEIEDHPIAALSSKNTYCLNVGDSDCRDRLPSQNSVILCHHFVCIHILIFKTDASYG